MDARDWPAPGRPGRRPRAARVTLRGERADGRLWTPCPWGARVGWGGPPIPHCSEVACDAAHSVWTRERGASADPASRCRFLCPAGRHSRPRGRGPRACLQGSGECDRRYLGFAQTFPQSSPVP